MNLTNKHSLPQPLLNAINHTDYRIAGDYSISNLIDSPQVRILKRQHKDDPEMMQDVSDKLYNLMGSAMHLILQMGNVPDMKRRSFLEVIHCLEDKARLIEKHDSEGAKKVLAAGSYLLDIANDLFPEKSNDYLYEKTLTAEINGVTIYGSFDLYHIPNKKLSDYKWTTVYNYVFEESRKQSMTEVNCFAYLLRENGFPVDDISLTMMFRDWSKSKMTQNKDYPTEKMVDVPVKVFSQEQMHTYLSARVKLHKDADNGAPLNCTGSERWSKAGTFVVKNRGSVKALNNSSRPTRKGAENFIEENKHKFNGLYIEERPGEDKRCAEYCQVNKFCQQYKSILNQETPKPV